MLHAGTIANLSSRLDPGRFIRIERGTIVNIDRIQELQSGFHGDTDVVLKTGTRLRASRTYARDFARKLDGG